MPPLDDLSSLFFVGWAKRKGTSRPGKVPQCPASAGGGGMQKYREFQNTVKAWLKEIVKPTM